jgi:hypothetical protein
MSDILDQIIEITSPLFNFFYEWRWLILPLAYFESCFFTASICKNIMQKKGYDDLKQWYRVGLFLNVFGIMLCRFSADKTRQPVMSMPDPQGIHCRRCGQPNEPGTIYCRFCGNRMD